MPRTAVIRSARLDCDLALGAFACAFAGWRLGARLARESRDGLGPADTRMPAFAAEAAA